MDNREGRPERSVSAGAEVRDGEAGNAAGGRRGQPSRRGAVRGRGRWCRGPPGRVRVRVPRCVVAGGRAGPHPHLLPGAAAE